MPVLALGGERGLNLWTMVSGWAVAAFVYALVRRHLGINWSLAAAVVFLTTPAVLYGAGSGQVEIRLALFALVAAFAAAESRSSGDWRFAVLAGLAVGFFAGGKFTGLLFGAACGVVLLIGQRWLVRGTVFGLAVLAAGSQWYAWNWINAGDPVFPMTFKLLGTTEPGLWNEAQDAFFRSRYFGSESAVPSTLWWLIAYPFKATLDGLGAFESRRAGLGPYILLALPFALAGAWHARHRLARHALLAVTLIAIGFYVLWFLSGFSQRVRHVLPVYPLLLIPITVAAAHWATNRSRLFPLALFVGLTVAAQMAGQGLFALKFIHYQVAGENREAFLSRNVHRYAVVPWVNAALGESDRLLHGARQINFLLDVPYHQVHPMLQAEINLRPERVDPSESLARLRRRGVSHILTIALEDVPPAPAKGVGLPFLARDLVAAGCADPGPVVEAKGLASRTLPTERGKVRAQLLTLTREDCPW
jgi:hypothetical protein